MLNKNELLACIKRKNLTQAQVAEQIGMTSRTFANRLKKGVFGSDEIERLIVLLDITNPMLIFFNNVVS